MGKLAILFINGFVSFIVLNPAVAAQNSVGEISPELRAELNRLVRQRGDVPETEPYHLRIIPPEAKPFVRVGSEIILCIHGGPGSRLEECGDLIKPLHEVGLRKGTRFTIISFDQPNQGYSSMVGPEAIVPSHDKTRKYYPLVAFNEEFIVAFVDALDKIVPIKNRNIYVVGGSTGGALTLRLAHRSESWIKKVVAWNPASVWTTYNSGLFRRFALLTGFERSETRENAGERSQYFTSTFGMPTRTTQPNPEEWYRGNRGDYKANRDTQKPFRSEWPCKWDYIAASRLEQEEVYNEAFRQWHWRLGTEMLLFSFFNDDWAGPAKTAYKSRRTANFEAIRKPTLLVASDDDDWNVGSTLWFTRHWENRWTQTRVMASRMHNTPGYALYLPDSGHSIHNERPMFLAQQIVNFLLSDSPSNGPLQVLRVTEDSKMPAETCQQQLPYFPHVPAQLLEGPYSVDFLMEPAKRGGRFSNNQPPGRYSMRLKASLRAVANKKDPTNALAHAAERYYADDITWGNAFADLAVTGRGAYDAFREHQPTDEEIKQRLHTLIAKNATQFGQNSFAQELNDTKVIDAVRTAQDRAYRALWGLRDPNNEERLRLRRQLGWLAVSGEDDPPDRPVNVPSGIPIFNDEGIQISSYPQFEIAVTMCASTEPPYRAYQCPPTEARGITWKIRFTVANPE